jgi:hypothetical protein
MMKDNKMKITTEQLKSLVLEAVKEQVNGIGMQGRSGQRKEQAAALISATNLKNAEAVLKLLARQTEGDIPPDQKRYLNMLKGKTSKEDLKVVLDKFYVDGLNGKSILGYSAMTPNKLKDLINNMKSAKAAVGSEETPSEVEEVEADEEEETGKKYQTKAMTGGASLEDIAKELGVSVQRAAELEKKAMERFKKAAVSKGGLESMESLKALAVPAAKQFVERLGEVGVEDFVMDVLKMPRATEKDIELLVDLQAMVEAGAEEEAAAKILKLYMDESKLPVIKHFTDALRAKETAGRPSLVRKFF